MKQHERPQKRKESSICDNCLVSNDTSAGFFFFCETSNNFLQFLSTGSFVCLTSDSNTYRIRVKLRLLGKKDFACLEK